MWHASVSVWTPDGKGLNRPDVTEREAIKLLAGVGGDSEWWLYNPAALVGHLRVPVTEIEYLQCPSGLVQADAGPSGPRRPRTYPKGSDKRPGRS